MHGVEALYCMCDRERWFSDSNHFAISLSRLFIGVSAFCVLLYELTTKQTDLLSQHSAIQGVKGCMCVCACVCVCLGVCVYYSYIHMRVTPGMCGRRAARWLTWTRRPACGWIPTGPFTSPKRGRVTSEHTSAGWPQWVAMTPAVPTSESGLHIWLMSPLSYLAVCFFSLIYVWPGHDGWMFSALLWFITALLSNPSNSLIFTMQGSRFGCLILLFAASLVWFCFSLSLCPSHTHTHTHTHIHPYIQAATPCSRKPNSSSEHHREEVHQPHMGPGLRWQQPPDPLHPGGLRKQWVVQWGSPSPRHQCHH